MKNYSSCLAAIILCAGCGLVPPKPKQMYQGNALPLEEVAVVSEGSRLWLHVVEIDGQYIVNPVIGGAPFTKGLHVLPGLHTIKVKYMNLDKYSAGVATFADSQGEVTLDTKAGHTYVLRGDRGETEYKFAFEDKGKGYNQECLAPELYHKIYVEGQSVPGC